eukprot:CAMPEP_0167815204 /NCGR_PEP_ID=MMETSP0112_2-20121227/2873_1 /TAXON_ID=91324 /ORGANISM="Lotharella globosa, Strain CCCM811" /LENGTH=143 /DNA_ID=CAMNT_0007714559 /DNA_START=502 /DNA_END=933 /DNA_ORIENTATION=+
MEKGFNALGQGPMLLIEEVREKPNPSIKLAESVISKKVAHTSSAHVAERSAPVRLWMTEFSEQRVPRCDFEIVLRHVHNVVNGSCMGSTARIAMAIARELPSFWSHCFFCPADGWSFLEHGDVERYRSTVAATGKGHRIIFLL